MVRIHDRPLSPASLVPRSVVAMGAGDGDGLESGMDAEGPEEMANVVPDCLGGQVEVGGDLLRRAALLQKTKHLDLTRREVRVRRRRRVVGASLEQPEHADHPLAAHQRHRTDLHRHPRTAGRDQNTRRVRGRGAAEHLPGKQLAGTPAVLGRHDGREVATANITEKPLRRRIDPPHDPRRVEDIARNTDTVQSPLDITAHCQPRHHHRSVADSRRQDTGPEPHRATGVHQLPETVLPVMVAGRAEEESLDPLWPVVDLPGSRSALLSWIVAGPRSPLDGFLPVSVSKEACVLEGRDAVAGHRRRRRKLGQPRRLSRRRLERVDLAGAGRRLTGAAFSPAASRRHRRLGSTAASTWPGCVSRSRRTSASTACRPGGGPTSTRACSLASVMPPMAASVRQRSPAPTSRAPRCASCTLAASATRTGSGASGCRSRMPGRPADVLAGAAGDEDPRTPAARPRLPAPRRGSARPCSSLKSISNVVPRDVSTRSR